MSTFLQRNTNELNELKRKSIPNAKNATKKRVDEIIKLYTERTLSNVATTENLPKGLTPSEKNIYDKAFQKYKDKIKKTKETKPLHERMTETREKKEEEGKQYKKRGRQKRNTYFVMYDLYIIDDKDRMSSKSGFKAFGKYSYLWNYEQLSATIQIVSE